MGEANDEIPILNSDYPIKIPGILWGYFGIHEILTTNCIQEEPMTRPAILPEVNEEDVLKSASVPPGYVATKLGSTSPEAPTGGGSHILRDVVELLKGASDSPLPEASTHLPNNHRCLSEGLVSFKLNCNQV